MRALALLLVLMLVPSAVADHDGPHGLGLYAPATAQFVHHLPDVQTSFSDWEARWPERVERQVIGTTGTFGLPLETIRITDESVPFDAAPLDAGIKLRVYLDGGHHGNEYLGTDLIMYYLEDLLGQADAGDARTLEFLRAHEVWATPIVNVEGNTLDTRKNAEQVDVNRNYGFEWGGPGSSDLVADPTYRGPAAFSEAEVAANADFARAIMPDLWITMHTGVAEFYWPWGWTFDESPDHEFFESLEKPFEDATNDRVDAMVASELYLAAGATDDWGYGELGIPTHTFEVHEDQYVPVYGEGVPAVIADQLAGLEWLVENTRVWGAWLEMHVQNGELHVYNDGWGKAVNITFEYAGTNTTIPVLEPGEMHQVPLAEGPAVVTYRQLLVDAPEAKTRVVTFDPGNEPGGPEPVAEASGVPVAVSLAAVAVVAVLRRR